MSSKMSVIDEYDFFVKRQQIASRVKCCDIDAEYEPEEISVNIHKKIVGGVKQQLATILTWIGKLYTSDCVTLLSAKIANERWFEILSGSVTIELPRMLIKRLFVASFDTIYARANGKAVKTSILTKITVL